MVIVLIPIEGIPEVAEGDDLATQLIEALESSRVGINENDVVVVCQKVVSKAEGRVVRLSDVEPSERALEFAGSHDKDPRLVELALKEAREVLRMRDGHLITVTGPGWVGANSAIDRSNQVGDDEVTLLPEDADRSAASLRDSLMAHFGQQLAVVVSDTFGRPWRLGQIDLAIGAAGIEVLRDLGGGLDRGGRLLEHTVVAVADQLAGAAGMVMGKADGIPAVLVRGFSYQPGKGRARDMIRPPEDDLFR